MNRYSYPVRLILMAGILSALSIVVFPAGSVHLMLLGLMIVLLGSGLILLYLQKSGRMTWNGPNWGARLKASPAGRRVLMVLPALCATSVPILLLQNHRWGLSDTELSTACGVLLGISISVLVLLRFKGVSCCDSLPEPHTQQGGTK